MIRYSTVMVRAPRTFHDQTLVPQFEALATELDTHLEELTDRVIREAIHSDVSEATEAPAPKALPEPSSRASGEAVAGGVDDAKGSPT